MAGISSARSAAAYLRVGDARRPRLGRAILGALLVAVLFELFIFGVKETPALGSQAPWADDPFDVVTSFAIFFVPIVWAACATRVPLCRRDELLPLARVADLLRGAWLLVAIMLLTLVSDWIALGLGANRTEWSKLTPVLVALLGLMSTLSLVPAAALLQAARELPARFSADGPGTDWLADAVVLIDRAAGRLGPLQRPVAAALGRFDREIASSIRRRPIAAAATLAGAFAGLLTASAWLEEGLGPILLLFAGVGWCGMFAFLVAGGAYLGLVRGSGPSRRGASRRLVDATVLAGASVPVVLAFRDALWWVVGSTPAEAGLAELARLLAIGAILTFGLALATEALAGVHDPRRDGAT